MIAVDRLDNVGYLTLDRPDKLNALSTDMLADLESAVRQLATDDVQAIVVNSSSKNFSAGADLTEWAAPTAAEAHRMSRVGVDAFAALANVRVPTIAVITGVAAGGGLELALACDLRIASASARLGLPEAGLANLPAYGGINRLLEIVGRSRALELLYTAELITADRAAQIGLINWVFDDESFDEDVNNVIAKITASDPRSTAFVKALTGGAPIDGLLATFTSQTPESRARKTAFLEARTAAKSRTQGAQA